ncbi:hypothetical protein A6A04_00315 [Paramagnetospirillum marisnigri]|uniref:Uncharacterized protein n=1 Tax=Paramagnetospirillum marisnigri TaxID=1285242 RepID=A0A178MRU4_9PROT|nr:hypothetical protein [Paramagnetospirillum marisnigri]OAN52185.1 hypothetical protein A6A04_00315 [Paramagnetospirillum marisnigri]
MKPSSGLRFAHARLVCQDALSKGHHSPAICEVIRVAENIVWYSVLGGDGMPVSREWCEEARFPEICANAA